MSKASENSQAHFRAIGWLAVRQKLPTFVVAVETFKRSLFFEPTSCIFLSGSPLHFLKNGQTLKEASKKKKDVVFLIATKMHPAVLLRLFRDLVKS